MYSVCFNSDFQTSAIITNFQLITVTIGLYGEWNFVGDVMSFA